jgi:Zn-dependent protease
MPDKPSPESPRRIGGPLVIRIIIAVIIGAALGSALGYFGQCSSGTCPLTSTWWRGAIYGGVMGLLFGLTAK